MYCRRDLFIATNEVRWAAHPIPHSWAAKITAEFTHRVHTQCISQLTTSVWLEKANCLLQNQIYAVLVYMICITVEWQKHHGISKLNYNRTCLTMKLTWLQRQLVRLGEHNSMHVSIRRWNIMVSKKVHCLILIRESFWRTLIWLILINIAMRPDIPTISSRHCVTKVNDPPTIHSHYK